MEEMCSYCNYDKSYCTCFTDDLEKKTSNLDCYTCGYAIKECICNGDNGGNEEATCAQCGYGNSYCTCNNHSGLERQVSHEAMPSGDNFRVFDTSGILKQRSYLIKSIGSGEFGFGPEEATQILVYFQWNKENFEFKWWDHQDEIRQKSGVDLSQESIKKLATLNVPDSTSMCLICYGDEELYALKCGHHFCKWCWTDYLKVKTEDFLVSLSTVCPQLGCSLVVNEKYFFQYLKDYPKEINNFNKSITRNFIGTNKSLKVCIAPGCNYIIECFGGKSIEVKCLCNKMFCFGCEKDSHRPISCELLAKWQEKHSKDSADDLWVKANCKICPHCGQRIERSTGCLYMYCDKRAGGCGKAFCYVCETDWAKHTQDHFTCNKYTPSVASKENEAAMIKEELKRMEHYYNRFTNFKVSQKMAMKLNPKIEAMQDKFIVQSIPYSELKFLHEALECLINTNNTISNTYIFGYYLMDCPQKELFEYNQGMLEKNSDNLYKLIDIDFEKSLDLLETSGYSEFKKKFEELKIKAVNYTAASNRFQEGVNNYVESEEMRNLLDIEGVTRVYKPSTEKDTSKSHWKYKNEA